MKKNILKPFLFIAVLCFFIITNTVQAQSENKITISVKDIKYDDPNFTALRETLKKNPKVKLVKPSYAAGVAILSFTYAGETPQLWEEIPKASKRFFSLSELGDDTIALDYLDPKKNGGNSPVVTNPAQVKTTNKKDCFECDYFPMCAYDETKSFGGKVYRGLRDDDGSISYYYCENGEVTKKWISTWSSTDQATVYDPFKNIEVTVYFEGKDKYASHSQVILKSNVPEGAAWGEGAYKCLIKEKGNSITVNGVKYNNVIAVEDGYNIFYYAKGKGLVKVVDWKEYMPDGIIDPDIIGVWVIADKSKKGPAPYWKFNADGTGIYSYVDETFKNDDDLDYSFKWRILKNNVLYKRNNTSVMTSELNIKKLLPEISLEGWAFRRLTAKDINTKDIDTTTYTIVDSPAMFPGNKDSWTKYLERNFNSLVPQDNKAPKGTYEVKVRFTVAKDGTTKNLIPLTNFKYGMEEELMRLLRKSPKWIPAKKDGKFVNSIVEQSLVFKVD